MLKKNKSKKRRYDLLIIGGFGHVGLPIGIVLASKGLQVALYDRDESKKEMILAGKLPFLEYDAGPVLKRVIGKNLHIVDGLDSIPDCAAVMITVGTPVDEYLNPKLLPMMQLMEQIKKYLTSEHLIILRSTVYPGATDRVAAFLKSSGKKADVAFCPERIAQGYAVRELLEIPQIVSGCTPRAQRRAAAFFKRLGVITVEVSVKEAELAKLFSNAWRYTEFAVANQFYMIAEEQGADFRAIRKAMTQDYKRGRHFPGAGFAAGPCLLKDTMQLSAFYKNNLFLGHASMLVNEGLPSFVVSQLRQKFDLKKETVGILGMAFKANVDDIRDSLSYKLGKLLRFYGGKVLYSDEFAKDHTFISKQDLVKKSSIIILGTPHDAYKNLKIPKSKHVVDMWDLWKRKVSA